MITLPIISVVLLYLASFCFGVIAGMQIIKRFLKKHIISECNKEFDAMIDNRHREIREDISRARELYERWKDENKEM